MHVQLLLRLYFRRLFCFLHHFRKVSKVKEKDVLVRRSALLKSFLNRDFNALKMIAVIPKLLIFFLFLSFSHTHTHTHIYTHTHTHTHTHTFKHTNSAFSSWIRFSEKHRPSNQFCIRFVTSLKSTP